MKHTRHYNYLHRPQLYRSIGRPASQHGLTLLRLIAISSFAVLVVAATHTHPATSTTTSTSHPTNTIPVRIGLDQSRLSASQHSQLTTFNIQPDDGMISFLEYSGDPGVIPRVTNGTKAGVAKRIPAQTPFDAQCMCAGITEFPETSLLAMDHPSEKCAASTVRVTLEDAGDFGMMSIDDVKTAIGSPVRIKWAKIKHHHFSDMTGRTRTPVLAIPGGDITEFISAVDAYEEQRGTQVTFQECKSLLEGYLLFTEKITFYMATDSSAIKGVENTLNRYNIDLTEPPPDSIRNLMLSALELPEHVGCRALRHMMMNPQLYNIDSPGLISTVIRAFYTVLWDKMSPASQVLRLVELEDGPDNERAMLRVITGAACGNLGIAPLIQPRGSNVCDENGCGRSFFVSHGVAAEIFRQELSQFFAGQDSDIQVKAFMETMNGNGAVYEKNAIEELARGESKLPVYLVEIS